MKTPEDPPKAVAKREEEEEAGVSDEGSKVGDGGRG